MVEIQMHNCSILFCSDELSMQQCNSLHYFYGEIFPNRYTTFVVMDRMAQAKDYLSNANATSLSSVEMRGRKSRGGRAAQQAEVASCHHAMAKTFLFVEVPLDVMSNHVVSKNSTTTMYLRKFK